MGVNRIVMHNGVVWWLPPVRPKARPEGGEPTTPRRPRRSGSTRRPRRGPGAGALPPAGFIPLSSLGIPGIDSILESHADFYRDAYDRAVRDAERGQGTANGGESPGDGVAGLPADDDPSGEAGRAGV